MDERNLEKAKKELIELVNQTDADIVGMPNRHKRGMEQVLTHLPYYLDIYTRCMTELHDTEDCLFVDFGGGHGLLGTFAKLLGFQKVIYVDFNADALRVAQELKNNLGVGADEFLCGDMDTLKEWLEQHPYKTKILIATDVIEHIYNLESFFSTAASLNFKSMVFTTASNPENPLLVWKLRRYMQADETGNRENPNFLKLRRNYIMEQFPELTDDEAEYWAEHTRGLVYADIDKAVSNRKIFTDIDPYNTCDPRTGSWTERILPLSEYQSILEKNGLTMNVRNGFYNTFSGGVKGMTARILNRLIEKSADKNHFLAPFIFFDITCKNSD